MTLDYLSHAIIELTSECNLHCRHCYNWWKQEGETPVSLNSYRKAFRVVSHLITTTTVRNITFTGGEPAISERFIELVLHAKLCGKKVTVITNGNGKAEVYRQLAELRVDRMEFSIHSFRPEVHDAITRWKGSWQRATDNMKAMLEAGVEVTPVIVVTSLNHEDVLQTVNFFYDLGITSVMVNRYNLGGEGLNHPNALSATAEQLRTVFRELNDYSASRDMLIVSGVCTPYCLLNPDDYPEIHFGSCPDNIYNRPLTFDIEGNLRVCNHSPVVVGNILKQPLSEILASAYLDQWNNLNMPFCRRCTHLSKCRGGCRAASEQMGLSLGNEDPIIHELNILPLQ